MEGLSEEEIDHLGFRLAGQLVAADRDPNISGIRLLEQGEERADAHSEQEENLFLFDLALALAALYQVLPGIAGQLNSAEDRVDGGTLGVRLLQVI